MALETAQYRGLGVRKAGFLLVETVSMTDTIVDHEFLFTREVNPQPDTQDISFEGDDTVERVVVLNGMRVTVSMDKFDMASVSTLYGKQVASGITGVESRLYFGDAAENAGITCGVFWEVTMLDEATKVSTILRYTVPLATAQVIVPQPAQYNGKHVLQLQFVAQKTAKDLLGADLDGVPDDGCFYFIDRLAA
jgi:hypothetical protein